MISQHLVVIKYHANKSIIYNLLPRFYFFSDQFHFTSSSYELLLMKEPDSELRTQQVVISMTVCVVSLPSDAAGLL